MNDAFLLHVESVLHANISEGIKIVKTSPVQGGCINHCYRIETTEGNFFLKYNDAGHYPLMFEREKEALQLLKASTGIQIPEVVSTGRYSALSFIVMEFIESAGRSKNFFATLGEGIAQLHQHHAALFGLEHSNYIGSLQQDNGQLKNGIDFFIYKRLMPMIEMAEGKKLLNQEVRRKFDQLFDKLPALIPQSPPALLHGDLWSGNYISSETGNPCLIDPAVYYGNREADIAMTRLFGGFDVAFYDAYQTAFPLEDEWEERVALWNLYPLLVHVNLFGSSYLYDIQSTLRHIVG